MNTFEEKIWNVISTHNNQAFIPLDLKLPIMTNIQKRLSELQADTILSWENLEEDFDSHPFLLEIMVRPFVLETIEEVAPDAWFKALFFPVDKQREIGLPV